MSPLNPIYFEPCAGAPVASNSKYVELLPRHPATCARQPPSGGCGTAARVGRWAPGRAVGVPAMLQRCMPACIAVTVDAACSAYLYIHLDFPWCVFEVVKFEARSKGARARAWSEHQSKKRAVPFGAVRPTTRMRGSVAGWRLASCSAGSSAGSSSIVARAVELTPPLRINLHVRGQHPGS